MAPQDRATARTRVEVSPDPLDLSLAVQQVAHPGAGAVATFTGVTRDNFQGKAVTKLIYEAYVPMALAKMQQICDEACQRWPQLRISVSHRTGEVAVGQPSVVIAASSPHRHDALQAVQWAIDELKARVPIWKKEFFTDGSTWKENAEGRPWLQQTAGAGADAGAEADAGEGAEAGAEADAEAADMGGGQQSHSAGAALVSGSQEQPPACRSGDG